MVDVIVIDDGSSDPTVARRLAQYGQLASFRILANSTNLGYTRTVNRGIAEAAGQ